MQQLLTYPGGRRRPGLAAGLAVSILLHVLLLAVWRTPSAPPARPDDARRWTEPLTVRLLPPPPKPITGPKQPQPASVRSVRAPAPAVVAAQPAREPAPITATPAPPTAPEPDMPPRFDRDAARSAARGMANDLATPSTNWAADKLNEGKAWQETRDEKLGGQVARAARSDCRTAYAGAGLFAPLIMLMDKKDSGCKF